MKFRSIFLFALVFAASGLAAQAQDEGEGAAAEPTGDQPTKYNTWSVGLNVGHILGLTDIKQYDYAPLFKYENENRFGVGITGSKALSNIFTVRGQFTYGAVAGTRRGNPFRSDNRVLAPADYSGDVYYPNGVHFSTNILEGNVQLVFNISNLAFTGKVGKERRFALYMSAGHGLVQFDTKATSLITEKEIGKQNAGKSGKTTEAVNPFGLGIKYKLNKKFDIMLDGTIRRVNSDKLDGFVQGASPDYYAYTYLTLNYKFGKAGAEGESIEWVNPLEAMNNDIHKNRTRLNAFETDADADGVSDFWDKDTATPEGDKVDGSGVSMDVDGDGVSDSKDEDNFTPKGATVNESGVAIDSDGDGVADALDLEPNTEKGQLVNFQGMSIAAAGGGGGGGAYMPSIHFALNGAAVNYNQYDKLATIARGMKANKGVKITLTGHTDASGSEDYNLKLGERRAQAVADHLTKHYGIDASRMTVTSKGEADPLADKINSMNRRVDIDVK